MDLFRDVPEDNHRLGVGLWTRRALVALFTLTAAAALWGVLGQRARESRASGPAATLRLSAPTTVRGGLLFQSRIEIRALTAIEHPRLVLDDGWLEGMQLNTLEPAPESESSRDGRLVLSYGALEPGDLLRVWLHFQVEPTLIGSRPYDVELDDENRPLARIARTITVLP
jgi:hypothetical protein